MPVQTVLHWGESPPQELTLNDQAWVGAGTAGGEPVAQRCHTAAAASQALEHPCGFPPISQAMVPGDRVVIAIGEGVREAAEVVRGVVQALVAGGADPAAIAVLLGSGDEADQLRPQLGDLIAEGCQVLAHHADHQESLCYLAARDDQPLLVNRTLFDADLVIPVGCARSASSRDPRGPFESIYPRFSDLATQRRYARADALDAPTADSQRRQETDEAGWQLGAPLVVQVVPRPGGGVAEVVAGVPDEVERAVQAMLDDRWTCPARQRASLVVVTLAGGPEEQTWDNVARALYAAGQVADLDQSAVAVCTELAAPPGEALQQLMATGGDLEQAAQLATANAADAAAAWEIYKARCRGSLYFMSRLEDEVVEDLGMTPLATPEELNRLANRSDTCIVLNEGQHAVALLIDQ